MAAFWRQNSSFYQKYLFHTLSFYNSHPDIKAYLEIILSLLAVIVLGVFAIKPTLTTIAELSAEVQEKEQVNQTLEQKITALSSAQEALNQNQSNLEILNIAVPTSPMVQDYIKQLEAMALENGVTIDNLQVGQVALVGTPIQAAPPPGESPEATPAAVLPTGAAEIPLTITVSGPYPQLNAFLQSVENHRRPMAIDAVSSNAIDSGTSSTIQLNIDGRLPYFYVAKETNEIQ